MQHVCPAQLLLETRYPGFICFKCLEPVRYPRRWHRDALLLGLIDPSVLSIAPILASPRSLGPEIAFAFSVSRVTGKSLVAAFEGTPVHLPPPPGYVSVIGVSRDQLRNSWTIKVAKQIWRHKLTVVAPSLKVRVANLFRRHDRVSVQDLLAAGCDMAAIYSLLANGDVVTELVTPIVHQTIVKLRPAAPTSNPYWESLVPDSAIHGRRFSWRIPPKPSSA